MEKPFRSRPVSGCLIRMRGEGGRGDGVPSTLRTKLPLSDSIVSPTFLVSLTYIPEVGNLPVLDEILVCLIEENSDSDL